VVSAGQISVSVLLTPRCVCRSDRRGAGEEHVAHHRGDALHPDHTRRRRRLLPLPRQPAAHRWQGAPRGQVSTGTNWVLCLTVCVSGGQVSTAANWVLCWTVCVSGGQVSTAANWVLCLTVCVSRKNGDVGLFKTLETHH